MDIIKVPVFTNFPIVMEPFKLFPDCIFCRACEASETLTNRVRFFGSMRTANIYNPGRQMKYFKTISALRLLDMRYVITLMRLFLTSRGNLQTRLDEDMLLYIHIALGIPSMGKQIDLIRILQNRSTNGSAIQSSLDRLTTFYTSIHTNPANHTKWMNVIEPCGVRVAITDIDYIVMDVLKSIFGCIADGIIAPRMNTPFHNQGTEQTNPANGQIAEEVIFFSPVDILEEISIIPDNTRSFELKDYLDSVLHIYMLEYNPFNMSLYQGTRFARTHGGRPFASKSRDIAYILDTNESEARKYDKQVALIRKLTKYIQSTFPYVFRDLITPASYGAKVNIGIIAGT